MRLLLSLLCLLSVSPSFAAKTVSTKAVAQITARGLTDAPVPAPEMSAIPEGRYWVVVRCSGPAERSRLAEIGLDIAEIKGGTVAGVISSGLLEVVERAGFKVQFKTSLEKYNASMGRDFPQQDQIYHNYDEQNSMLKDLAKQNVGAAAVGTAGASSGGRGIAVIKISLPNPKYDSRGPDAPKKPAIALVGQHHAREHVSAEVPLNVASFLLSNKDNPKIKTLLENVDVYVLPSVNPDGAEYDIVGGSYHYWRKNARKLPDGNIGVDLNRNYDSFWGGPGASPNPSADTYRGPSAFSEPESQTVKAFFDGHPEVTICISYHSYGGDVMYPWGGSEGDISSAKDLQVFKKMTSDVAKLTGYRPSKSSEMYVATGDFTDWLYAAHNVFALTIELSPKGGGGGFYPGADAIGQMSPGNIDAVVYLMGFADNPYRLLDKEPKSLLDLQKEAAEKTAEKAEAK